MAFQIGETVICSIEVKNDAGTLVDPATSMQIKIDQTHPQYANRVAFTAMTKDAVGKYHYDFATDEQTAGEYKVTYLATDGTRKTAELDIFKLE